MKKVLYNYVPVIGLQSLKLNHSMKDSKLKKQKQFLTFFWFHHLQFYFHQASNDLLTCIQHITKYFFAANS
jgi:hypothetical protein